ncbi:peptidase M61 [Segetibacter koreensis]|uniref:M61 family metallopeptidase n=1 Tax=Segetibacter koreensis TaxID=398037 RepID=UPI0012F744C8|nr:peptidase M61 [Segetibacter koreensis]
MSKEKRFRALLLVGLLAFSSVIYCQREYRYKVDLIKVENDTVNVELQVPKLQKSHVTFCFPKIIPGTYAVSDYGKFISQVKAFDNTGKRLPVSKLSEDKWKITHANSLTRLTYKVSDIFDTKIKHNIYPMAATNFEVGKDFVINTPGFFGFFDGYAQLPFTISIAKPASLYGSTSLIAAQQTPEKDVFKVNNVDALYDSPIMYSVPDTTTVTVGNCHVLVSVYSPNKLLTSEEIAKWMSDILDAAKQYLGGKLPADKYAFLYYFKGNKVKHSFPAGLGGALEHTTSSFYYLPEMPADLIKSTIVNASTHEFFHIITPLTIASKEVKEFNYNKPVLSKHLWLYEGVTEYTAHYVQVKYGLTSVQEFLDKLSEKITNSRTTYDDTLPFTKLSKGSAGKYARQYGNVYEKGALIAACLDIYLLHLSNGTYGLKNLTHDLGIRYGKKRYFNDDELFGAIEELTYPEVEDFLNKYVAGSSPIPYEYFFGLAGIQFSPRAETKIFSMGGIVPSISEKGIVVIAPGPPMNEFGKKVGYKVGDELYAIDGVKVSPLNLVHVIDSIKSTMKEGDNYEVRVGRKNKAGDVDTVLLKANVFKVTKTELNKLAPMDNATPQQKFIRQKWLTAPENVSTLQPPANPADVNSIDAITKATYSVISGAAVRLLGAI